MKPVNLLPGDAPVVAAAPGKPNLGMIGGAAAGLIAVIGVAGYFAMARVDSVKSETQASTDQAAQATTETASVRSQVASLGQPVVDSDRQLAQGYEQTLVAAYTERYDFVRLSQELRGIMDGTNGWYVKVEASSVGASAESGGGESRALKIVGYVPSKELAAGFNERANSQSTIKNATIVGIQEQRLVAVGSRKTGTYWKFIMKADLVDTVAPSSGGTSSLSEDGGTTVGSSGELKLSLASAPPKPKPKAKPVATKPAKAAAPAAAAVPAQPKNPFDVAATVAGRGGAA